MPDNKASIGSPIKHMLLAVILTLAIGSFYYAVAITCLAGLRYGLSFNSQMLQYFAMGVMFLAFPGALLLIEITLVVVLPVLYFRRGIAGSKWMMLLTALLGGGLMLLSSIFTLHHQVLGSGTVISSANGYIWTWGWPLVNLSAGALYGGLFGAGIWVYENRVRRSAAQGTEAGEPGQSRSFALTTMAGIIVCCLALATVFLHVWFFREPTRKLKTVTRAALQNSAGMLVDARALIQEASRSRNGSKTYSPRWNSGTRNNSDPLGDVFDSATLNNFDQLGDVFVSARTTWNPGVVTVEVSENWGLYITPNPTSATLPMLKRHVVDGGPGYLKVVNENIYQYYRSIF